MNFLRVCRLSSQVGKQINGTIKSSFSRIQKCPIPATVTCSTYREFSILQPSYEGSIITHHTNQGLTVSRRFKKRRGNKSEKDNDEEEEEDDDDAELAGENPLLVDDLLGEKGDGSGTVTIDVPSLRLDVVTKTVFSMSRTKVEEVFYKGDLLINGQRASKKSIDVSEGDEIDWVKSINAEDNRLVDIKRAILLKLPDKTSETGRLKIKMKKWNELTVEAPNRRNLEED